tara:strand:+ start:1978 stop:2712 length:735 start_codon:yes stop_codon:yes gene_type:complete
MITVILNCYKRVQYLEEQIQAIKDQSIPAEDIWIWYNKPEDAPSEDLTKYGCKTFYSTENMKYHARFAIALMAKTKYVAFFDDDTIPGKNWFKNCIDTINAGYDGILGTIGVRPSTPESYYPMNKVGWGSSGNTEPVEVDLVGHAWFMDKNHLRYMWMEDPVTWENAEDMQISWLAQKHGGVKTYVPPHPKDDQSLWGSHPDKAVKYGSDEVASWIANKDNHFKDRDQALRDQVARGWRLLCMK